MKIKKLESDKKKLRKLLAILNKKKSTYASLGEEIKQLEKEYRKKQSEYLLAVVEESGTSIEEVEGLLLAEEIAEVEEAKEEVSERFEEEGQY